MGFDGLINGILVGCGLYMAYMAYLMKAKGELKAGWLVSKNIDLSKSKDLPGYIKYMFGRTIFFAICTTAYGLLGMYDMYVSSLENVIMLAMLVFFALLLWFAYESVNASKKYLAP